MEIILKQDVPNLGHKDDIVVVRNGYASNYLIPQGFAIMATPSAKKVHAENLKQRAHKEAKLRDDAAALAAKLEGTQVKLATKISSTGKIFGSVNNIQVGEALANLGFDIDRRNITIVGESNIKEIGTYDAVVKIYKDVKANIKIEIVGEE
ncbi:MAG: 50S ribosomal protein L9 [Bacteroidetes bacterium 41-46]|jgi:large subunit ribosomal protein L9|nr:MAG: 50S ribosomal protein L9 [Bacteroidetes bacterium 41-46]